MIFTMIRFAIWIAVILGLCWIAVTASVGSLIEKIKGKK